MNGAPTENTVEMGECGATLRKYQIIIQHFSAMDNIFWI
jgi:hypothetical protein